MSKSIFTLVLVIVLLAQCCMARPTKQDSSSSEESKESIKNKLIKNDSSSSSESSEEVSPENRRKHVIAYVAKETSKIGNLVLEKGSELLKKTLEDETVTKVSTPLMQQYIKELHELVEKMDSFKGDFAKQNTPEYFEMIEAFTNSMDNILSPKTETRSAEQVVLELALKKNGVTELKKDATKQFKELLIKFEKKTDKFVAELSEQDKQENADMLKWYENYKNENDSIQKAKMFIKFIGELSKE